MVDFAGLLQPEVAAQMVPGATYDGVAVWSINKYKPPYTVLVRGDLSGLKEEYLEGNCRFVHQFPEEDYDTMAVEIYTCPEARP
jgi:hypothetical protein